MKKHAVPILFIAAAIIMWLAVYSKLPDRMPIHWDLNGNVNGYSSKLSAMLIFIALMVFPYLMLSAIPKIDPKKENYPKFKRGYSIINLALLLLFFAVNVQVILSALGFNVHMGSFAPFIVGLLFIVIGNYMPQLKPNYFMGIRVAWTLNDSTNWKKTHRFGGKVFMIGGLLFILTVFLPNGVSALLIIPVILLISLLPVVYSYLYYRKQVTGK